MPETKKPQTILAIETSCDETAVAIARGTGEILVSEVASQILMHQPYGGVVPELASREHNLVLRPLIDHALSNAGMTIADIDAIAATAGPGLSSSLLIGNTTGKALALARGIPFYSINHMEGHLLSPFIGHPEGVVKSLALIVSGGHTQIVKLNAVGDYELMGQTRDDAAGEAFDKVGKMLGLPYPGGPIIDQRAPSGDPTTYDLPRSMIDSGDYQFSFSGLKTAVHYLLEKLPHDRENLPEAVTNDLCASFQQAVIDVLVTKTMAAARETGEKVIGVSGGVSCNSQLRSALTAACDKADLDLRIASPSHSTDNAAMIAYATAARLEAGLPSSGLGEDIDPNLPLVAG